LWGFLFSKEVFSTFPLPGFHALAVGKTHVVQIEEVVMRFMKTSFRHSGNRRFKVPFFAVVAFFVSHLLFQSDLKNRPTKPFDGF
jgi:hypothetical protein